MAMNSFPSINETAPLLSFQVAPVDPQAAFRAPWCLSETFAGLFRGGSDGGQGEKQAGTSSGTSTGAANSAATPGSFEAIQFAEQPSFKRITGPLQFVRFKNDGTVESGSKAALDSNPRHELCGLTVELRQEILQNKIFREDPKTFPPTAPKNKPELWWVAEQGKEWETVIPTKAPLITTVRHRTGATNRTVKLRSQKPWPASSGFKASFDFNNTPIEHGSEPALRLSWGDKYSIVFRGKRGNYPSLERRVDGQWVFLSRLDKSASIDEAFWSGVHSLKVYVCGDRLLVDWNGSVYWTRGVGGSGVHTRVERASWPAAPLRLSVVGVACNFQVHQLTGEDDRGKPIIASVEREVPAPSRPFFNAQESFFLSGENPDNQAGGQRSALAGTRLDRVQVHGQWNDDYANYKAELTCLANEAPLLGSFTVLFPPPATVEPPEWIELRHAVSQWSVDSGDPESLPDAAASLNLSVSQLNRLVPQWRNAVLPYRPILIRARKPGLGQPWVPLFRGFLTPESASRNSWNDYEIPLTARGPMMKTMEPYALIDERYPSLDSLMEADRTQLFGGEAVKFLLGTEFGHYDPAITNINGNGDPLRFTPPGHYPLLSNDCSGYYEVADIPQSGAFRLPPPFGERLNSWIDQIANDDYATWFFDNGDGCWYYGRFVEFLIQRGDTVWTVSEGAPSVGSTTLNWPLLSSLSLSGLLDGTYNDVRVWGAPPEGSEWLMPSFIMGRAGDTNELSVDPLSVAQSGRRTLLKRDAIVKLSTGADDNYTNAVALWTYREFEGRPPKRLDLQFDSGFLGPRWGEIIKLPHGFAGPTLGGTEEEWRILQVKHSGSFSGDGSRFETLITTRSLSGSGQ